MPNHCSSSNKSVYNLLWNCCTCNAPWVLRFAVCHATCSSSSFLTAAPVSFTPLRSFLPPFRFITPRSQLFICFKAGHPIAKHKATHKGMHQPFASQRYNTHRVPFRCTTSFIHFSSVQSTRCPLFCSPAVPISAAFAKCCPDHNALHMAHSSLISPCSTKLTCIVPPPPYPDGKNTTAAPHGAGIGLLRRPLLPAPHGGSQARPVVPPSRALRRLASNATAPQVCGAAMLLFLPQALLPAGLTHFAIASKKALLIYV
jgi:hypothetical protein